ncbi:MAG: hypothetical protein DDT37_01056 [Firmicutes bacterium]|nr:hypothetical protein [candidate division NPL-UPA2 bacterium]MBT9154663.1 hypothetical protein [candidate division NPL-UPA2 bacterium]MBT9156080.1 hypothetical protein [candidate division NPL-UPA2 bacterium]
MVVMILYIVGGAARDTVKKLRKQVCYGSGVVAIHNGKVLGCILHDVLIKSTCGRLPLPVHEATPHIASSRSRRQYARHD